MNRIVSLAVTMIVVAIVAASIGGVRIPFGDILGIVLGRDVDPVHRSVFLSIRLPRIALGLIVGASLGVSGTWVNIGVSHDRLLLRVDVGQRGVWVAAHAARAAFTAMEEGALLLAEVLSL